MFKVITKKTLDGSGLRERKRSETLQRIATVALKLFIANGYEKTTLDEIATEAGISRRTFFYYYTSKEEILKAWKGKGLIAALHPAMLEESSDQSPINAVRHCLLKLAVQYEDKESLVVDRLHQSTEALRASRQMVHLQMEKIIFEALSKLYPGVKRRRSLQLTAAISMGIWRLTLETWREERSRRPFAEYLRRQFDVLREVQFL